MIHLTRSVHRVLTSCRFASQGLLVLLLALCCSCAHRPRTVRMATDHRLRLASGEACFISTAFTKPEGDACGPQVLRRMLQAELSALGMPIGPASDAAFELVMECRNLPEAPRNQPPLAPGSRLWYQRRFYAPTFARTNPDLSKSGKRQLSLRVYTNKSAPASERLPLWEAKVHCQGASDEEMRAAVRSLAVALNGQRMQ